MDKQHRFFPDRHSGQNIESLISAPLTAVSKANAMMQSGQVRFLLDYCFVKDGEDYRPVTINMKYSRGDAEGVFEMPLVCLIPINSLAVDNVKLGFDLEISFARSKTPSLGNEAKANGVIEKKSVMTARVSKKSESNVKNQISVEIETKQIPISQGLATLIDVYSKNINFKS